jgi:hypothetical protein
MHSENDPDEGGRDIDDLNSGVNGIICDRGEA